MVNKREVHHLTSIKIELSCSNFGKAHNFSTHNSDYLNKRARKTEMKKEMLTKGPFT